MKILTLLVLFLSAGLAIVMALAIAQQGPQSFTPLIQAPHLSEIPEKVDKSTPSGAKRMGKFHVGAGEYVRVWRSADRQVHFELQVIYPSTCYQAGKLTFLQDEQRARNRGMITIEAQVDYKPGMCAQSATPIQFSGVIPINITNRTKQALFIVTNMRNSVSSSIGPVEFN